MTAISPCTSFFFFSFLVSYVWLSVYYDDAVADLYLVINEIFPL